MPTLSSKVIRGPNDSLRLGFVPPDNFRYAVSSILEDPAVVTDDASLAPEIRVRYLQLPPLDPRIVALAEKITVGLPTDTERARAIEVHLRTSYGYTLDLARS